MQSSRQKALAARSRSSCVRASCSLPSGYLEGLKVEGRKVLVAGATGKTGRCVCAKHDQALVVDYDACKLGADIALGHIISTSIHNHGMHVATDPADVMPACLQGRGRASPRERGSRQGIGPR